MCGNGNAPRSAMTLLVISCRGSVKVGCPLYPPKTLHEPSCRNTDEYNDPEQEAINHEWPSRELLQDSHQPPDGKKRGNRGHNQSKQKYRPPVAIEVNFVK